MPFRICPPGGAAVVLSPFMPCWLSGEVGGRLRGVGGGGRFGRRIPASVCSLLVDGNRWRCAGTDVGGFFGRYSVPMRTVPLALYGCESWFPHGRRLVSLFRGGVYACFLPQRTLSLLSCGHLVAFTRNCAEVGCFALPRQVLLIFGEQHVLVLCGSENGCF